MSQNSLLDQVQQRPAALKTTVQITGVISLSDEDAERLNVTNKALSKTLMELSMLSNNNDMPSGERAARLFALREPVMTSADALLEIVTHATDDIIRDEFIPEAKKLLGEVKDFHTRLSQFLNDFEKLDESERPLQALKYAQDTSNGVLTVLQKCMELLSVPDHATVAAIDEACDLLARCAADIQRGFIQGLTQEQIVQSYVVDKPHAKLLIDASTAFVTHVTTCLRAFSNRLPVITDPEAKSTLESGMAMLQTAAPHFLNVAQGTVADEGDAEKLIEFLQKAKACVRKVPPFSARVLAEFCDGTALGIAASNLSSAVERGDVAEIGETARKYALEVTSVVSQCRAIGVDKTECDMAQAALADVIRLAKIATETGDPEDIKKFKAALDYLTKMVQGLPRKFSRDLYEESTSIFDAAVEMSKGSLIDFVNSMK